MTYNNATAVYGNNKVASATPAELTLMLYEGAIKFCNIAKTGFENKDYEKINTNIQKARRIIVELQTTLNHDYPVAEDFDVIYTYIFNQMVQANVKKDEEILDDVIEQLRDIRNVWKEVMKTAKDPRI